ncbi:hypothetical protein MKZ38_004704 [Zalerion maritima]|uniref:Uncharacterized protein n=1 Tax=Zalerion maritima TaxID=339359 RepID=A0AAD5WPQ5_9PEZI|nr:hypothetical protein MKZ38_004704 [Zalerion maritima]
MKAASDPTARSQDGSTVSAWMREPACVTYRDMTLRRHTRLCTLAGGDGGDWELVLAGGTENFGARARGAVRCGSKRWSSISSEAFSESGLAAAHDEEQYRAKWGEIDFHGESIPLCGTRQQVEREREIDLIRERAAASSTGDVLKKELRSWSRSSRCVSHHKIEAGLSIAEVGLHYAGLSPLAARTSRTAIIQGQQGQRTEHPPPGEPLQSKHAEDIWEVVPGQYEVPSGATLIPPPL